MSLIIKGFVLVAAVDFAADTGAHGSSSAANGKPRECIVTIRLS